MENKNILRKEKTDKDKVLDGYKRAPTFLEKNEKNEKSENPKEKMTCTHCGNDTFRVYITIVIDDARLYCSKCGKDPED